MNLNPHLASGVALYCVSLAKLKLYFPEFLFLHGSGLALATGEIHIRSEAAAMFTLGGLARSQGLLLVKHVMDLLAHLTSQGGQL